MAAFVHDQPAYVTQKRRLVGRADQGLAAVAQRLQRAVELAQLLLLEFALGDVDVQP